MNGFSLRMSARSVEDARKILDQVAELIEAGAADNLRPGRGSQDHLLRVGGDPDATKSTMAFCLFYGPDIQVD